MHNTKVFFSVKLCSCIFSIFSRISMSGYASYSDAHDAKYGEPHQVPIIPCTSESIKEYGRLVHDFDAEEVWITTWPQTGSRPVLKGNEGGVTSGDFRYKWVGDELKAANEAVGGNYTTGLCTMGTCHLRPLRSPFICDHNLIHYYSLLHYNCGMYTAF